VLLGGVGFGPRPDVAAAFGRPDWEQSGFDAVIDTSNTSAGRHVLYLYFFSTRDRRERRFVTRAFTADPCKAYAEAVFLNDQGMRDPRGPQGYIGIPPLAMQCPSAGPPATSSLQATLTGLALVAADGQFLGTISSNAFDSDSVCNQFGRYGSQFSSTSIRKSVRAVWKPVLEPERLQPIYFDPAGDHPQRRDHRVRDKEPIQDRSN
jgi:hypothetical protein